MGREKTPIERLFNLFIRLGAFYDIIHLFFNNEVLVKNFIVSYYIIYYIIFIVITVFIKKKCTKFNSQRIRS